jgi:prevent-host-death family protein
MGEGGQDGFLDMDIKEAHNVHMQKTDSSNGKPDHSPAWGVAEAKQRFSEVVRAAEEEPQMIYNRDRRVAAVVGGEALKGFLGWQARQGRTLAAAFDELRDLAAEEGFELEVPPRRDRDNPFAG